MKTDFIATAFSFMLIAAGVFFAPHRVFAREVEVSFTANLTNETGWVYTGCTKITNEGKLYISSKEGTAIISPTFDFAVTSVTVVARHTNTTGKRKLLYAFPVADDGQTEDESLWREITPEGEEERTLACSWPKEKRIHSIGLRAENGSDGNIYILSAKICGISIPYPPENLETTRVGGNRIVLKWRNSENAVAGGKVSVYKTSWDEESFEMVRTYDFNEEGYKNAGGNDEISNQLLVGSYPDFAGSTLIYLPTNTVGQIQISKRDEKGVLKHKGFESCDSLFIDMTVRRYFSSKAADEGNGEATGGNFDSNIMTIGYEDPEGTTNEFASVTLGNDFKREIIPLRGFPADTPILFNATGNKTKHRVIIDEIKFIANYSPAGEKFEKVQEFFTDENGAGISNLEKSMDYVIKVTALDADGRESDAAELRVKTASRNDDGFKITVK